MNDHDTTRERIAKVVDMQMTDCYVEKHDEILQVGDHYDIAMGVIAHLWRRADDPDVAHTVDSICIVHGMSRTESEGLIETVLTALLGPKPVESFHPSDVGQAVELYRAVANQESEETDER